MEDLLNGFVAAQSTELYQPKQELIDQIQSKKVKITKDLNVVDIPFVYANDVTLQGFGRIIKDFDQAEVTIERWPSQGRPVRDGNLAGLTEGTFRCFWQGEKCLVVNEAVGGAYLVGLRQGDDVVTNYANYHPDGSQIFYNNDHTPFMIILAKPCPDELIKPTDFVAFYCDGQFGIELNTGTWHQANFPLLNAPIQLRNKQGKVHGVVEVVFDKEFDVYVRVKDAFTRVPSADLDVIPKIEEFDRFAYTNTKPNTIKAKSVNSDKIKAVNDGSGVQYLPVEVFTATEHNVNSMGKLVNDFQSAEVDIITWPSKERSVLYGCEGGIAEYQQSFVVKNGILNSSGDESKMDCKWIPNESLLLFRAASYCPDGSKVVFAVDDCAYIMLLSDHKDEETVRPDHFKAYRFPAGSGIALKPSIWHSQPFPLSMSGNFFIKQSAVRAQVDINFDEEFNVWVGATV